MLQVFNPPSPRIGKKIEANTSRTIRYRLTSGVIFSPAHPSPFKNFYLSLTILLLKLLSLNFWNRLCMKMQHKHSHMHTAYSRRMTDATKTVWKTRCFLSHSGKWKMSSRLRPQCPREMLTFLHSPGFSRGCGCHLEAAQALQATHTAALARESEWPAGSKVKPLKGIWAVWQGDWKFPYTSLAWQREDKGKQKGKRTLRWVADASKHSRLTLWLADFCLAHGRDRFWVCCCAHVSLLLSPSDGSGKRGRQLVFRWRWKQRSLEGGRVITSYIYWTALSSNFLLTDFIPSINILNYCFISTQSKRKRKWKQI